MANLNRLELGDVVAGAMRWGSWGSNLSTSGLIDLVEGCLDLGIHTFDHADIYGNYSEEQAFGRALVESRGLRNRLQIVTKCGIRMKVPERPLHRVKSYDSSASHIEASVEASLRNFRCEHLDLLLLHRPDYLMDPESVAAAFDRLRSAGKVRYFGVSNFSASQFALLHRYWPDLQTQQLELSLMQTQALDDGTLDQALGLKLRPMIWGPLAGGRLMQEGGLTAKLASLAAELGCSTDVLAYAWVMRHPSKPVLVTGSSRLDRIALAVEASRLEISAQDWYDLLESARGKVVP